MMTPENKIKLLVSNTSTSIVGKLDSNTYQELRKKLGYIPGDAVFKIKNVKNNWNKHWDGVESTLHFNKKSCRCSIKKDGTHFPTGLLNIVRSVLMSKNISFDIYDMREKVKKTLELEMSDEFEERDYQRPIIEDAVKIERGMIKCSTGSGKTSVAAGIIKELGVSPFIFYVPSIDLLKQACFEFNRFILYNNLKLEVGAIGDKKCDIKDINVMTVQTAVRACGGKYVRFDDEDEIEKENPVIIEKRKEILSLLQSAKGFIADEIQHWKSESCQIISDNSVNARYRFGMSATIHRDSGDDILIDSCFGKQICNITASFLIEHPKKYLVRPTVYLLPFHRGMPKEDLFTYAEYYRHVIVENQERNNYIAKIAKRFRDNGRIVLILCQQIAHGEALEELIEGSVFLHGVHSGKQRKEHLDKMRNREASITISSSLPPQEKLLIKNNNLVDMLDIGDICNNEGIKEGIRNGEIYTLSSLDGKFCSWKKIIATHKHLRKNKVLRVVTNRSEEVYVTENHSLVDAHLNQVLPLVGNPVSVPFGKDISCKTNEYLNVAKLFIDYDNSVEVCVRGMTQPLIRKLKSIYKFIKDEKLVSGDTRRRIRKNKNIDLNNKKYRLAINQFFENFKYYKFKYRAKLKNVANCDELFDFFDCYIYIRRSRKNFYLPVKLKVTEDLAIISGLMCSEGHIKNQTSPQAKSRFDFVFAALVGNTLDGRHDENKRDIRSIFKNNFYKCFGSNIPLTENDKQIRFNCKLIYYLFKSLKHVDETGEKRVPYYIFNSNKNIQEAFLWGFYLGDGSKQLNKERCFAISLFSSSRPMICSLSYLLKMMGLPHYTLTEKIVKAKKRRYSINIIENFYNIGIERSRGLGRLKNLSEKRTQRFVEIADEKYQSEYVYDISVEESKNFVAGFGGVLCHNSIFDEGIDVRALDTLILSGAGKSPTRALQRVGRVLRPYVSPSGSIKTEAVVVDIQDNCKYMREHAKKRERMYRTEPSFIIEKMDAIV